MCFAACSSLSTSTKKDRRVIGINNLSEYCYLTPEKIKGDKFTHCFRQTQLANYRRKSKNNRKLEPSRFSVLAQGLMERIWSVRSASRENAFACVNFSFQLACKCRCISGSSEIGLRSQVTFKIINK